MKPTEIDEGIGDWLAKKGLFGRKAGIAATARELSKTHNELRSQAQQMEKQKFVDKLVADLEAARNSGIVAEMDFSIETLNRLVESAIINEASITVDDFMTRYIGRLLANMYVEPDQKTQIHQLISDFSSKYVSGGKIPDEAGKLYDAIQVVKSLQGSNAEAIGSDYGSPKQNITVDIKGRDYTFDASTKEWTNDAGVKVISPRDLQILNKAAYDEARLSKGRYPFPSKDEVFTSTKSGKTYNFTVADKKWKDGSTEETDPNRIQQLNKAIYDRDSSI